MRQKVTFTIDLEIDYEAALELRGKPGIGGPDGHPPISGLELLMTDTRADILEIFATQIREGHDLVRVSPITLGCRIHYGQPYEPAYEPF